MSFWIGMKDPAMVLRVGRELKGLSMNQLAKRIGCTYNFISRCEHGKDKIPVKKAPIIADIIGVPEETLRYR